MDRRSRPSASLVAGLVMAAIILLIAIVAPLLLTESAVRLTSDLRQGPSAAHWFGTDEFGRDILARALVATRLTVVMAAIATILSVTCGVILGGVVWLLPRLIRDGILRLIDSSIAFPSLVLALVIAAILGPGSFSAVVAIGVAGIPSFARLSANLTGSIVHRDYVVTARLLGVRGFSLFTRHLLPNIAGPLLMLTTSSFALTLLEISSLSFVGLGVQSPEFDYGRVLNETLAAIYVQPWGAAAPSIMLIFAGVTVMLIGDGLAATLDPRGGRRRGPAAAAVRPDASPAEPDALLEVSGLVVTAPTGAPLVRGISFSIRRGEILGLVGESGSGKSLTAMAIAGLLAEGLHAEAVSLRLDDLDLRGDAPPRRLATDIGLVYQDPGTTYNPSLRMGTQLTEVARVHLGLGGRQARTTLVRALDDVSIREPEERMKQYPHQLSGGMLQRATIASSMVTDPKLIIADESTTALDVTVQAEVLRQFRRINRTNGTAMLFISHDISVVQELCDRVLVMRGGKIVERLTAEQLRAGDVHHPYTRGLLDATPAMRGDHG